ncbi:carnitine carrier Crc1p [Cyanidioschyzon merolae strain 10D]|jgi:hypothetical protein|uniref:Carnitine carrier Crc1p n=1 Tax=Cyanidioschyzon merolae (strain NIES-3377 / 10D) TaxID=280699 RepID=M1VAS8_CYAM1|nr:carnitine carrier Crc1p [Cyanidioschyzon merolae strain 10D]BAM82264.1 carnitine carrier Crc1p [Cyanidioschyzon merolae strain 10D]|eukprot:XP_005538300.1 carnitine carrier Crc1p [Cyanidioschyzon merolae strain 10D]
MQERKLRPGELVGIGALAGVIELCIQQPTIYFKNQIQRSAEIVFRPSHWYRGLFVNAASIAPITGIQFAGTGIGRNFFAARHADAGSDTGLSNGEKIAAACFGGALSATVSSPAELVMIQQQKRGTTLVSEFVNVARQGPFRLYKGFLATAIREGIYTGGYLGLAPVLRAEIEARTGGPGVVAFASSGIIAGVVAASASQWADTIKTIQQADIPHPGDPNETPDVGKRYRNFFQTARKVYQEKQSIRFFFSGLVPRGIRTVGAVFILNLAGDMLIKVYGGLTKTVFIP